MDIKIIERVLNNVVKGKYPDMDTKITVRGNMEPQDKTSPNYMGYTVMFYLHSDDYYKFYRGGIDKHISDVKELIRDTMKMLGITNKVNFYFWEKND